MSNSQEESLRRGIEVMTAWTETTGFQLEALSNIARDEGIEGLIDTTYGLANLCGILLIELERRTSEDSRAILQGIAANIPKWLGE